MPVTKGRRRYDRKPSSLRERTLWYMRRIDKKLDRLTRVLVDAGYDVRIRAFDVCRDEIDIKILDAFALHHQLKTSELCREIGLPYDSKNRMMVIGRIHSLSRRAKREIGEPLILREGYTHRAIWVLNEKILDVTPRKERESIKGEIKATQ